jgi:hypothetical protein
LAGLGVKKEKLPPALLNEYRAGFERYRDTKFQRTRALIEGLTLGPHSPDIFTRFSGFSSQLKRLAYRTAISVCEDERIVFALSAVSQEGAELAEEWTRDLRSSPILRLFLAYLNSTHSKTVRLPLALQEGLPTTDYRSAIPIDRLFGLATLPFDGLRHELRNIPPAEIADLASLADGLFQRMGDRGFEKFVKLNLAVFLCMADPSGKSAGSARQVLVSSGEPAVAEILALTGKDTLAEELRKAASAKLPGRERLIAALIDALRRHYPEAIESVRHELDLLARSRTPVVPVAARAALLQLAPQGEARFGRLLLSRLRSDQQNLVSEWLLRNPEFVRKIKVAKAPLGALASIVRVCEQRSPQLAVQVAQQMLCDASGPERYRYWEEAIGTLARIGGVEADSIFCDFLIQRIPDGWEAQLHEIVSKDPGRTLLRRNFWRLFERAATEQSWMLLFNAYKARASESELAALIQTAFDRGGDLATWIAQQLLPALLSDESISPTFLHFVTNRATLATIAKTLAGRATDDTKNVASFRDAWTAKRDAVKERLLVRVRAGIRIALRSAGPTSEIHSRMSALSQGIEKWVKTDSPKPETPTPLNSLNLPAWVAPSIGEAERFFRAQPRTPAEMVLFAGTNPWIIDIVLEGQAGPWPKLELLADQIARTFTGTARLRRRAEAELANVGHIVRADLAVALRQGLADIEADLTGYFVFRSILDAVGLSPVMPHLGARVEQNEISSQDHKVIRDPGAHGPLRVFGLGIRVDKRTVGSAIIMNSGDDDDSD